MNRARTPRRQTAPRSSRQLVFRCALLLPRFHAPNTKELVSALGTPEAVVAESKVTAGRTGMTVRLRDGVLEIGLGVNPDGDPEIAAACRSAWWWPQACMTVTKCEGRLDLT